MKLSDFQKEYHWMNGLSEYFEFIGHPARYSQIYKALYHDNWYRKRDVMIELCQLPGNNKEHTRAWMNVLLHEHLEDVEIKPQLLATLLRKYMMEDEFLTNICKFINYWTGEDDNAAVMPDMNDFLSRGQVRSKIWLVEELKKVVDDRRLGNVLFYGGWYNFTAHLLFQGFDIDALYSLDVNRDVIDPTKRLYPEQLEMNQFLPKCVDVNKIRWQDKSTSVLADDGSYWDLCDRSDVVVNTSCEHMDNTWFDNLPEGTFVVLQTNDYFKNPQHSNCCADLEDAKSKYSMREVLYAGELDTQLYNRFMLIGIK